MERIDDTGFGNIRVIQRRGYGYGVDAVLLAAFASGETGAVGIQPSSEAAELGTDCGIVAFILTHKTEGISVTGIEKREDAAERAIRAAELNGLEDRVRIITADVGEIAEDGSSFGELKNRFDCVVSNPPYFRKNSAIPSTSQDRYIARHETTADIWDFARAASLMLRDGGSFYLIHRPDRLPDVFEALRASALEPKEMQMVVPETGKAANLVLIHAAKNAGPELKILPDIAIHAHDGGYTEDILRIYERA